MLPTLVGVARGLSVIFLQEVPIDVPIMEPVPGAPLSPLQVVVLLNLGVFLLWLCAMYRPAVLQVAAALDIDTELSWAEQVWILVLFIIAVVLGILAAYLSIPFLLVLSGFFTILATAWWLFGFLVWPWEDEFWEFYHRHPFLAFFLGALVLIPLVVLIAMLFVSGWWLVLVGVIVALWWAIFLLRCGWITWVEKHVTRFFRWTWRQITKLVNLYIEVTKLLWQKVVRTYRQQRTTRRRTCASWHWAVRWICILWTWVVVVFWVIVAIDVWVLITFVTIQVVPVLVLLWVLVLILVVAVGFVIKFIFWCW